MNYDDKKLILIKEGLILLFGIILGMMLMITIAACVMEYRAKSAALPIGDTALVNHSMIPDTLDN